MLRTLCAAALSAVTAFGLAGTATAQAGGNFGLELNNAQAIDGGCRLTYVATNNTGSDLSTTSYEVAVFDQEGGVTQLLVLEFGELPAGKTKVVRFDLADQPCENISRLLVNNVAECTAAEGDAPDCMEALVTSSRSDIQFGI
ncbi:hypothetical protein RM543_04610 [Roseicyclus sp. F158]|uniref:Tat pathway signal sequence domain protein n=1 Tax=Tropicimonas omnivorans TaxID=3075590 RepID=A0ABU3DEH7_9RHOB|nr:hypothetical protein [Roseicyclus sp. F158]MDT0681958.1 hypothetical protein [Roseicyclus sp. F158]